MLEKKLKDEVCNTKIVSNFNRKRNTIGHNTTNVSRTLNILDEAREELQNQDI